MKKKPALQAVLDNISSYSEEQINELTGPHFPQWIKDQLIELRKRNGKTADDVAYEIAMKMIAASQVEK
jgi:adenine-specific DNA methylase